MLACWASSVWRRLLSLMESILKKLASASMAAKRTKSIEAQYAMNLRLMGTLALFASRMRSSVCRKRFMLRFAFLVRGAPFSPATRSTCGKHAGASPYRALVFSRRPIGPQIVRTPFELLVALRDQPVDDGFAFTSLLEKVVARHGEMPSNARFERVFKLQVGIGLRGGVERVISLRLGVGAV